MWTKEHGKGRTRTIYVYSHAAKSVPQNVPPPLPALAVKQMLPNN